MASPAPRRGEAPRPRGRHAQPPRPRAAGRSRRRFFAGSAGAARAGACLPKSTFGGVLIAASFSTVKLGFTSILNSMAVRLVGNERTVELNVCTLSM